MGEWSNLSYLRTADLDHVDDALTRLCAAEERAPLPAPPGSEALRRSSTAWYATVGEYPLWTFVVVAGAGEWTMLAELPFGLLGNRRPGAGRMRLADLAVLAGCDAFTFELSDGTAWVLAEANAQGETAFSGFPMDDDWFYHDEPLSEEHARVGFRLLSVPEPLREAGSRGLLSFAEIGELVVGDRCPAEFGSGERRWSRSELWYNGIQVELQSGGDIPVPGARMRHFAPGTAAEITP